MIARRWCVAVEPYEPTLDDHGARVDAWGAPVQHMVHGIAPSGSRATEATWDENRHASVIGYQVYSPCPLGHDRARWTLPDGTVAEQVGEPDDYRFGPFAFGSAGCVQYLRRVEG